MGAEPSPSPSSRTRDAFEARFFDHRGEQLYVVRHRARGAPRARVVMCGPFGLERAFASPTWTRWARALAARDLEAWRFDVRGHGESSGRFLDFSLSDWDDDVGRVAELARDGADDAPLVFHGLRFGALLAARAFARGEGDALLLWDPPAGAGVHLEEILRRKLAEDFASGAAGRRSRADLIDQLERAGELEVDGYRWSARLWREAEAAPLPVPAPDDPRPFRFVYLDRRPLARTAAPAYSDVQPVPRPPFWAADPALVVELGGLFAASFAFLDRVAPARGDTG